MASCVLRPGKVFISDRFAMWLLDYIANTTSGNHKVANLLLQDRHMINQLGSRSCPAGRLLLPLGGSPRLDQLREAELWVDSVGVSGEQCWAKELHQQQSTRGFVALTVFKQQARPGQRLQTSSVPGCIGTRLLLSNEHVKLWDFHVPPNTSCELHEHLHPYVFINRTSCETRGLDANLQPDGPVTKFSAGEFRYVNVDKHKREIHAFQNPGDVPVQQYIVEFVA